MDSRRLAFVLFATATLTTLVSARAVNISNTWMLPEEGFPVFYRYFRDRISWYEADAVCQFHHANLVTADSSSQYDAIRAYLKELDITENVWIGLSKTTEKPNFTWTDFRPLTGDGHWQQAIPIGVDPLCVAMDPAADFLWQPLKCGGPEIASFICELEVPSWAMGPQGCLLTELPSLTVLYIPEQLALELTSDCGLDGTKRIACKGNADREEILKQLTCAITPDDFEDKSTKPPAFQSNTAYSTNSEINSEDNSLNSKTTKPWIWTSNTIDIDYGMPTRHRRETEDTLSPVSTKSSADLITQESRREKKSTTELYSSNYDTEITTVSAEGDVTLDSSVSQRSDKAAELKMTQVTDSTTQDANTQSEEQGEVWSTVEAKVENLQEDAGEYPSAISQGQLFSIIENGTMFDIIELNETTTVDLKYPKDSTTATRKEPNDVQKTSIITSRTERNENLYTTVVYHKEPPTDSNFVTNKSVKKPSKKQIYKGKEARSKLNQLPSQKLLLEDKQKEKETNDLDNKQEKTLNKEIEMFPIIKDSQTILNRTHRKEVPVEDDIENLEIENGQILNLSSNNQIEDVKENSNQHIEIKIQDPNNNFTQMIFTVTTKTPSVPKEESKNTTEMIRNSTSEIPDMLMKEQFLLGETKPETEASSIEPFSSQDPLEPEPEAQPRPNRQRQLTRPQRRSFYPYFFSRVLG